MPPLHYSRLTVDYPKARDTSTFLGGHLFQRETRDGVKFFIEWVVNGNFLHQAGIKSNDRLVTVNDREIDGLNFDQLLDSIRSLNPIMFELERNVDGSPVTVISVLDIAIGDDNNPFARFVGFYYNTTLEIARDLIPIDVPTLIVYDYQSVDYNVCFKTTSGGTDYWLSTDGSKVYFSTDKLPGTSQWNKYNYVYASQPQHGKEPVILVPTGHTDHCLAANSDNILKLEIFDQDAYDKPDIPGNGRFLNRKGTSGAEFVLESSIMEGYSITRSDDDDAAVMTTSGSQLTEA